MIFNIFTSKPRPEEITKILTGIPPTVPVRIFSDQKFELSRQAGQLFIEWFPYKLTWVQKWHAAMHMAQEEGYRWCGYIHDDGSLGLSDVQRLIDAAQKADSDVFSIYTEQDGEACRDVYALFSVPLYFASGRHDENFDFYWADIELFNRQVKKGYRPQTIKVTTLTHHGSRLHKQAVGLERVARDLIYVKDKTYFHLKNENNL